MKEVVEIGNCVISSGQCQKQRLYRFTRLVDAAVNDDIFTVTHKCC